MGFPTGYTEVLLPKVLFFTTLSFLGLLRRLIHTLLRTLGFSDLVDPEYDDWAIRPDPISPTRSGSVSATLIREMLPVVKFHEIQSGLCSDSGCDSGSDLPESCAVCLYEFEAEDEIRRMRNCPHMFHRCCVDRWIDHDRKTCPLCRKCLVPDELLESFNQKLWAASGIPDFYSEYSPITNF